MRFMQRTRKIKETNRLLMFRNPDEEEILVIKTNRDDLIHKEMRCSLCGGKSYNYYILPRTDGLFIYCNLCFQWYRKDIDWKTIYYTDVFDNLINFVLKNRTMFTEEDLDLIDEFFDLKTNKKVRIRRFIERWCKD